MKKTNNYGLSLYDKEDKFTITAEENSLNNNMKLIDNALKEKANNNEMPTKVSELENDNGYLTSIPSEYKTKTENDNLYQPKGEYLTSYTEADPTVPNHVKNITEENITNWNNKSEFTGNYNDLTNQPTIPNKISELENDSGFINSIPSEYITEIELNEKGYLTEHQDLTNYPTKEEMNKAILENNIIKIPCSISSPTSGISLNMSQLEPLRYYFENNIKGCVLLNIYGSNNANTKGWLAWLNLNKTLVEGTNEFNMSAIWVANGNNMYLSSPTLTVTITNGTISDMKLNLSKQNNINITTVAKTSDVLTKTNTTSYTPSSDYHPTTKIYVDNAVKEKATISDMTTYIEEHKDELKGADGKDGVNGKDGTNGTNGKDGYTPVKGVDYFDGKDGTNGTDGKDGSDGYSPIAKVTQTDTGATITITDKNGTTTTDIINGKDGEQGVEGPQGPKGDKGDKGDTGPQGPQGPKGDGGSETRIVTQNEIHWKEGWQAPNQASGEGSSESTPLNLQNNHSRRMSMLPFWIPEGTTLTRNEEFYTAIDSSDNDSDGYPVRIMVSLYDPDNEKANPRGWVRLLYDTIANNENIHITKSGWYVLSITHGTAKRDTKTFGQPYNFAYEMSKEYEPNYVLCVDWGTYYNVRGASVNQPEFSNGLNWACRREPNCPYYLDNAGYGSEHNRGGQKTTDLTLNSKTGSAVAGIMAYKDEIWTFFTSDDDHSTLGSITKYRIYENKWIEYIGRCWVNAGHINSVHYDSITDTVVFGNGSISYTLEGEAYIINNFSNTALANAYNDEICLLADMGVDTISLPISTYGVKANAIPIGVDYYSGSTMSLIVALLTDDGNTLHIGHIKGTEELKSQYKWDNCTWSEPITIGDANEEVGPGATQSYVHCVQDMTVWQGKLLWGEGHGENRYASLKQTPTETIRESFLSQTMPKSNIHAITSFKGKLFGAGLNMFCMIDPEEGKQYTYGELPTPVISDIPDTPTETTYKITYGLSNVTSSNNTTSILTGTSYTAKLTANTGHTLETVIVTMAGVDITSSVYSNGTINIPSVTGNIVITAVAKVEEIQVTNLWKLSDRTEYTRDDMGWGTGDPYQVTATDTRTIRYDKYIRGATSNGGWNFNNPNQPTLTINGEDFTLVIVSNGVGLGYPLELEVGATYKITYTVDNVHRLYATYFDETGVYKESQGIVGSDTQAGTYTKTFTVKDYAHCQITFRAGPSTLTFSNISIVKA